jgi:glutamate synthase domain-containing protein 1/glutamate synthase domain-containing protein 3
MVMEYSIYPSSCGIFAVMRKIGGKKIKGTDVLEAIETARFRGSKYGAGFAVFNLNEDKGLKIQLIVRSATELNEVREKLKEEGILINEEKEEWKGNLCNCEMKIMGNYYQVKKAFNTLNKELFHHLRGRIISIGGGIKVLKGVGYPSDIAKLHNIYNMEGDLWLAHTRQPTNSPGWMPFWSHPFSSFNIAIVHNGDISSFGANMEFLRAKGYDSFVGTDSEVIAMLLNYLINEINLNFYDALNILVNGRGKELSGAKLDGPYAVAIAYSSGNDLYLGAIADKSKFRPIIIGEDNEAYYVASEEAQIRKVSPRAKVWTLEPGGVFAASLREGIINYGRNKEDIDFFFNEIVGYSNPDNADIDASGKSYKEINEEILEKIRDGKKKIIIKNVNGQRFIGLNLPRLGYKGIRIEIYGTPGNCLGNLNNGIEYVVYGNAEDDVGDTMHDGKIVIHGDARDVLAQTFQGGYIFVRGNAGNRVGIQMRQYKDRKPYLIIGGRVDDYLGEYMAGGMITVLGLNTLKSGKTIELTGKFVGSGMVGGKIMIRGKISQSKISLKPKREEIISLLKALLIDGLINDEIFNKSLTDDEIYLTHLKNIKLVKNFLETKHMKPLMVEYRELSESEIKELLPVLIDYSKELGVNNELIQAIISEKFTIISNI